MKKLNDEYFFKGDVLGIIFLSFVMIFFWFSKDLDESVAAPKAFGTIFTAALFSLIPLLVVYLIKKPYKKITYSVGIVAFSIMAILGQNGVKLFGTAYESLEQCVIVNMEGQAGSMRGVVFKDCRRQLSQ